MKKTLVVLMLFTLTTAWGMQQNDVLSNKNNQIMMAVERNDLTAVRRLIGSYYDNDTIIDLMSAYANKRSWSKEDLCRYLDPILKRIKDTINVRNKKGDTPLIVALREDNQVLAKYLIDQGADVNLSGNNGDTPIYIATKNDNAVLVKYLIDNGANVDKQNTHGYVPLNIALERDNEVIAKYLIDNTTNTNYRVKCSNYGSKNGDTFLLIATRNESEILAKYLIDHGANVNKTGENGDTPLIVAAKNSLENLVKYLVEHGAYVNKSNDYGDVPLLTVIKSCNKNIVKYLIKNGADVNYTHANNSVLDAANNFGSDEIVQILKDAGAE